MSWFKESQSGPPRVQVISLIGNRLKVAIGGKIYLYYANPGNLSKIEFFISKGWHGKALGVLNKLERVE